MPTIEEEYLIKNLRAEGTHFRRLSEKKSISLEEINQLWCPALRMLALNQKIPNEPILQGWSGMSSAKNVNQKRYLLASRGKTTQAYPILRHYAVELDKTNTETNTVTLIYDKPGQSGCIPQSGCNVIGKLFPNLEDGECRTTTGNQVIRATPLGKKGVVMLHSMNQTCDLKLVRAGQFQRFLFAPNLQMTIQRAAITLRRLAGGEPNSQEIGQKNLEAEILKTLPRLARIAADQVDYGIYRNQADMQEQVKTYNHSLPRLKMGYVEIKLIADKAYGPDPRTWAISIHTTRKTTSDEETQQVFANAWKTLNSF